MIRRTLGTIINQRLAHYMVAGGLAFVVEYSSFLLFYYNVKWPAVYANTASFLLGLATSFTLNKLWVFNRDRQEKPGHHQLLMYVMLALVNLTTTNVAIHYLIKLRMPAFIAKVLLILLISCWNFILFKKIIFKAAVKAES